MLQCLICGNLIHTYIHTYIHRFYRTSHTSRIIKYSSAQCTLLGFVASTRSSGCGNGFSFQEERRRRQKIRQVAALLV